MEHKIQLKIKTSLTIEEIFKNFPKVLFIRGNQPISKTKPDERALEKIEILDKWVVEEFEKL